MSTTPAPGLTRDAVVSYRRPRRDLKRPTILPNPYPTRVIPIRTTVTVFSTAKFAPVVSASFTRGSARVMFAIPPAISTGATAIFSLPTQWECQNSTKRAYWVTSLLGSDKDCYPSHFSSSRKSYRSGKRKTPQIQRTSMQIKLSLLPHPRN